MSNSGQTLFGVSGFVRWALSPFVLLFAVVMPLVIDEWTFGRVVLIGGMEFMCFCLLAGFWLPPRNGFWAFRILAGTVALSYAAYFVAAFLLSDKPITVTDRRSDISPFNALLGFLVIGLPSLWFALKGRFALRAEDSPEKLAAERQAYEERLLRPDWEFYEQHLQRPAPAALRELYADPTLVTCCALEFSKRDGIIRFNPLDKDNLVDAADLLGFDVVPFASDGCGDPVFLRPGKSEPDTVFIAYHEDPGKGLVVFADSVAAMIENLRKASEVA